MANKRIVTKYPGVYERLIVDRNGKQDTSYDITYRSGGKKIWEIVGRKSNGVNVGYASRVRADRIKEAEKGLFIAPSDIPVFEEALTQYMEMHMQGKSSYSKMQGYYTHHIKQYIGTMRLDKVRPIDVEKIKQGMVKKGLAPQSIKHVIGVVRQVYRKAIVWGLYNGISPTDGVSMPKIDNNRLRFLTEEEASLLLQELKLRTPQWHDIAYISLYTGMRLGEILSLKEEHINFNASIIHVMDAKAGTRAAYMTKGVCDILRARCIGNEYVFTQNNDNIKVRYISSTFKRVAQKLFNEGVTDARYKVVFHTLRHTFGSWLAQRGVPLYTIAELMGHASLEMTKRYSKLSPDTKKDAIALLPDFIEPSEVDS